MIQTPQFKELLANIIKTVRADFKKAITDFTNKALLAPSTDATIRKRVLNDITKTDSIIGIKCMEQTNKYPIEKNLNYSKKRFI